MEKHIVSTCDHFEFVEERHVTLRKFFHLYKEEFPMLAIIVDGWCGDTRYDCFDNFQVVRIHSYTTQPRVVCVDSEQAKAKTDKYHYLTVPVNYPDLLYRVIKGHRTVGEPETLETILKENQLPVLVQMACEPRKLIKLDTSSVSAESFGNLLLTEKCEDHYFLMNCVDGPELTMNSTPCMAMLSEKLTATPITGFRYQSKEKFEQFLRQLHHQIATSDEVYDTTSGNPAILRHDTKDGEQVETYPVPDATFRKMLQGSFPDEPIPDLPERKPRVSVDKDDDYEVIDPTWELPPPVPQRQHITNTDSPVESTPVTKKGQNDKKDAHAAKSEKDKPKKGFHFKHAKPEVKSTHSTDEHEKKKKDIAKSKSDKDSEQPAQAGFKEKPVIQKRAHVKPLQEEHASTTPANTVAADTVWKISEMTKPPVNRVVPIGAAVDESEIYSDVYVEIQQKSEPRTVGVQVTRSHSTSSQDNSDASKQHSGLGTQAAPDKNIGDGKTSEADGEEYSIRRYTIKDVSLILEKLKLDKYIEVFKENDIDGEMLTSLSVDDLVNELSMKKLEAIKVDKYVRTGHVPK